MVTYNLYLDGNFVKVYKSMHSAKVALAKYPADTLRNFILSYDSHNRFLHSYSFDSDGCFVRY